MEHKWLWTFTGTLFTPKGAYIQDDPEIRDGILFMDRSDLEKKINAKDPGVRHVPFGYKVGEISPSELAENPYVIALAGKEGVEKLAQVADKHLLKPRLWSFIPGIESLTEGSALFSRHTGRKFEVYGDTEYAVGHTFGLLK